MRYKISKIALIIAFLLVLIIPIININWCGEDVSMDEKRKLAKFPYLFIDYKYNENFPEEMEDWIDDNIGFRKELIDLDFNFKFRFFSVLPKESGYLLGPNHELNYYTDETLENYQRINLATPSELKNMLDAYEACEKYAKKRGVDYYYIQNWDKDTIYEEAYPKSVIRQSNISRMDQKVEGLKKRGLRVISCKDELIEAKKNYRTYPSWGDVTHYTDRGAFITYTKVMNEINKNNHDKYKVLKEDDYDIVKEDKGAYVLGNIHMEDIEESFYIKNKKAYLSKEEPIIKTESESSPGNRIYYNDKVDNNDTLLILGDSYIEYFLYDDFAESFHKTVFLFGPRIVILPELLDVYNPKVVIFESVERQDYHEALLEAKIRIDERLKKEK